MFDVTFYNYDFRAFRRQAKYSGVLFKLTIAKPVVAYFSVAITAAEKQATSGLATAQVIANRGTLHLT